MGVLMPPGLIPSQKDTAPAAGAFDVAGARKKGFSDAQIMAYLEKTTPKFDFAGARKAKHTDAQIIEYLSKPPATKPPIKDPSVVTSKDLTTGAANVGQAFEGAGRRAMNYGQNFGNLATFGLLKHWGFPQYDFDPKNPQQQMGATGLDVAMLFTPNKLTEAFKAASSAPVWEKAGLEFSKQALDFGLKSYLQWADPKRAAEDATFAGAVGATFELGKPLFSALGNTLGNALRGWARNQYSKILNPRGGAAQSMVDKVLLTGKSDDLVGRGVTAWTKKGLNNQVRLKQIEAANQLNSQYAKLGPETQLKLKPIFDDVYAYLGDKGVFKEDATLKSEEYLGGAINMLNEITKHLGSELATASPQKLREFRQLLDDSLYKPNALGVPMKQVSSIKDEYTQALARGISRELNGLPTIGKLDREYHFWATAHEIIQAAKTQGSLMEEFPRYAFTAGRAAIGAAVGEEYGRRSQGTTAGALTGAVGGAVLAAAMGSTAWRSVSSIIKDRAGSMLAHGEDLAAAALLAKEVAFVSKNPEEKQKLVALAKQAIAENTKKTAWVKEYSDFDWVATEPVAPKVKKVKAAPLGAPGTTSAKVTKPAPVAKPASAKTQEEAKAKLKATVDTEVAVNPAAATKYDKVASQHFATTPSSPVTAAELDAKSHYKGPGATLNKFLYDANFKSNLSPGQVAQYQKLTVQLDSLIAKHSLDGDMTLYRGVGGSFVKELLKYSPGETFVFDNFTSASAKIGVGAKFAYPEGVILKFQTPKGTPVFSFNDPDYESEYLFGRNAKFKVVSIDKEAGKYPVIHVDLVHPGGAGAEPVKPGAKPKTLKTPPAAAKES